jgi:hypothetical protein
MTNLVGLFGTHGTGKSTVLKGVIAAGISAKEISLPREAQKALGWTELKTAGESVDNMWALQDAILNAMYDRDMAIVASNIPTLVERTPADVWAYTEMWCKRLDVDFTNDRRAITFKNRCRVMSTNYKLFIQVPMIDEVVFVPEPNRADLASREDVENAMEEFVLSGGLNVYCLATSGKESRIGEAVHAIFEGTK